MSKKKILLLGDDLRMNSGVATVSRELVLGTIHHYDWVNIAGAIKHPETGKVIDLSAAVQTQHGVNNAYLKLYPTDGYGNEQLLFTVMDIEKPDAIMHFTDPRYWGWLYQIEHSIRQKVPLTYMTIWDSNPFPQWNKSFYNSVDSHFAISKQTENLIKWVMRPENCISINGGFDKEGNHTEEY